jgi:hypothetical protein
MVCIIDEDNLLFFLIDLIDEYVMPDVQAPVALQLVPERFANLRVSANSSNFFATCSNRAGSFFAIFLNAASTSGPGTTMKVIM